MSAEAAESDETTEAVKMSAETAGSAKTAEDSAEDSETATKSAETPEEKEAEISEAWDRAICEREERD